MGCLGRVDAGRCLVCLVACVGSWVCVGGVFVVFLLIEWVEYVWGIGSRVMNLWFGRFLMGRNLTTKVGGVRMDRSLVISSSVFVLY